MKDANKRFAEALQRCIARSPNVIIELPWLKFVILVGHLQLALKHPANFGPNSRVMRKWLKDVLAWVKSQEPDLAELLAQEQDHESDD